MSKTHYIRRLAFAGQAEPIVEVIEGREGETDFACFKRGVRRAKELGLSAAECVVEAEQPRYVARLTLPKA